VTVVPILLAVTAAAFAAASLRLSGLVSNLLAGYVMLVATTGAVTWLLSPFDWVTPTGLTAAEAVLAVGAGVVWWLRGRPLPSAVGASAEAATILRDPLTAAFVVVAAAGLAYELVLAVTVPPNNWDSLTYHLARVAAWRQQHGIHWIPNAPTARMNEFQPLAEQQILFLVVGSGTTALYALPQFTAQLAILAGVYGAARLLGYGPLSVARGTALLAMLSLVALEATTAQNDLVAASLPAAAVLFLLAGGPLETMLAGGAFGLGSGVKLTTTLALPVLVWLAWRAGRPAVARAAAGTAIGLLAAGGWGYVLNLANTGHLLGHGQGRTENSASPSLVGTVERFLHLGYRLFDLSVTPSFLILAFGFAGVAVGAVLALRSRSLLAGLAVWPLLAPALTVAVIDLFGSHDPHFVPRTVNEDLSGFGPVGAAALFGAPVAAAISVRTRDGDRRRLALAIALPTYMLLLAFFARYNIWITRFLVVPAVLTAPLFAGLCRSRTTAASLLAVGAATLLFATTDDAAKKLNGSVGRPWTLSQVDAMTEFPAQPTGTIVAQSLAAYERAVPAHACVGAVLDPDEPSYLLWGPRLSRRVVFLSSLDAFGRARLRNLGYVVISTGANAPVAKQFSDAGWKVEPLGSYWQLATAPAARRTTVLTTC
jgi:hypothetical protein